MLSQSAAAVLTLLIEDRQSSEEQGRKTSSTSCGNKQTILSKPYTLPAYDTALSSRVIARMKSRKDQAKRKNKAMH